MRWVSISAASVEAVISMTKTGRPSWKHNQALGCMSLTVQVQRAVATVRVTLGVTFPLKAPRCLLARA